MCLQIFFQNGVSNNTICREWQIVLDPDQAGRFVGPDLGPNCLQRLSTGKDLNVIKLLVLDDR